MRNVLSCSRTYIIYQADSHSHGQALPARAEFEAKRRLMKSGFRKICPFSFFLVGLILFSSVPSIPAIDKAGGSFNLRVDVDMVTIEVYAVDNKGKPVRNLRQEDFRLYEDGKEQEILSFDVVNAKANEPASLLPIPKSGNTHRGKTVLIILDDSTIPELYFKTSRNIATRYVREHMGPEDLFGVARWGTSMQVLQNLTDDQQEVLAAIERSGNSQNIGGFFEDMLRSLEQINDSLAPLKGQKSVMIYGRLGTYTGPTLNEIYNQTLKSARKSNVLYYTVDPGAQTGDSNAGLMGRSGFSTPGGMIPVTLRSLASESGGTSLLNTNDISGELDKLDQQISNYYILGFQSNSPRHDGGFRSIKVRTEAKGVSLKHRPGYQDRRPLDALTSSRQEQLLLTILASPVNATEIPIAFRAVYFYDPPKAAKVLIPARIRLEKTVFRRKGAQIAVDLNIMGVAYAEDGSIAARFSETLPINIESEKEQALRKSNLIYRNYFKLRPGKYRLKLVVSDESNNLGSMEQALVLPPLPEQGFAASSLVVAEQVSRLPDMIRNLQTQLLDESDPMLYSGIQIEPSVINRIPENSTVPMMFRIYSPAGPPEKWDLIAKTKLLDQNGKEHPLGLIHLKDSISPVSKTEVVALLQLSFPGVPPGRYQLVLETGYEGSSRLATVQTDLEFVK
jgi:VWFA-related protein